MNARFVSSVLIVLAAGFLTACGTSRPVVYTPSERSYNQDRYVTPSGRVISTRGMLSVPTSSGGRFYVGTMGGASSGATASAPNGQAAMHPSIAEPQFQGWNELYNLYCAPTATRAKQESFAYGGCQRITDELEYWRHQVSASRHEADKDKPQCVRTLSERTSQQTIAARECSAREAWKR